MTTTTTTGMIPSESISVVGPSASVARFRNSTKQSGSVKLANYWSQGLFGRKHLVVSDATFSPDGAALITRQRKGLVSIHDACPSLRGTSGQTAYIIDVERGGHYGNVTSWGFSPNGRLLVTGGEDGQVLLWHVDTGTKIIAFFHESLGHTSTVRSVSFSDNGEYVVSCDDTGRVAVWKPKFNKRLHPIVLSQHFLFATTGSRHGYLGSNMRLEDEPDNSIKEYLSDAQKFTISIQSSVVSRCRYHPWLFELKPPDSSLKSEREQISSIAQRRLKQLQQSRWKPPNTLVSTFVRTTRYGAAYKAEWISIQSKEKTVNMTLVVVFESRVCTLSVDSGSDRSCSPHKQRGNSPRRHSGPDPDRESGSRRSSGIFASAMIGIGQGLGNIGQTLGRRRSSVEADDVNSMDITKEYDIGIPGEEVDKILLSPCKSMLLVTAYDGQIRLLHLASSTKSGTITDFTGVRPNRVLHVQFSIDAKRIVVGFWNGSVAVWSINGSESNLMHYWVDGAYAEAGSSGKQRSSTDEDSSSARVRDTPSPPTIMQSDSAGLSMGNTGDLRAQPSEQSLASRRQRTKKNSKIDIDAVVEKVNMTAWMTALY